MLPKFLRFSDYYDYSSSGISSSVTLKSTLAGSTYGASGVCIYIDLKKLWLNQFLWGVVSIPSLFELRFKKTSLSSSPS